MKKALFTIFIVILGFSTLAQEVQFPPSVLSGGGGSIENNAINISRWRLSQVHVITLPDDASLHEALMLDDLITLYPNPVDDFLNIEFQMEDPMDFTIRIADVLGRTHVIQVQETVIPMQVLELNMSEFLPAMYLLFIESSDRLIRKTFPIQKI